MLQRSFVGRVTCSLGLLVGIGLGAPSCDDDDDGHSHDHGAELGPLCRDIVNACHYKDDGSPGQVNTCHVVGHDGDEDECGEIRDECVEACEAAPELGGD